MQYICKICGYVYDEEKGIPDKGIKAGTKWEEFPSDWKCPLCGASKTDFKPVVEEINNEIEYEPHVSKEMSAMEMSILCSNLAKGCEKQYMEKQADGFRKLSEVFLQKGKGVKDCNIDDMLDILQKDLDVLYPYANQIARKNSDRGAQRVMVWGEKVTRMLDSLLRRYKEEGESMIEKTNVWICSVCGFIYLGEDAPALCPVCKVPDWKFEKVEGRM